MAETLVDNKVCSACGADVRELALYCYHCGGYVGTEKEAQKSKKPGKRGRKTQVKNDSDVPVAEDSLAEIQKPTSKEVTRESNGTGEVKLKSAASMKGKIRRIEPKKIEIYWEEHENAPNFWFIGVSAGLILFSFLIYLIAMYLK